MMVFHALLTDLTRRMHMWLPRGRVMPRDYPAMSSTSLRDNPRLIHRLRWIVGSCWLCNITHCPTQSRDYVGQWALWCYTTNNTRSICFPSSLNLAVSVTLISGALPSTRTILGNQIMNVRTFLNQGKEELSCWDSNPRMACSEADDLPVKLSGRS